MARRKKKIGIVNGRSYDGKGYTRTVTVVRKYSNGTEKVRIVTQWTQKGREFIIHLLEKAFDDERGEV